MSHPLEVPVGDVPRITEWVTWWTPDPLVIGALLVATTVYTVGAARMVAHARAHPVRAWHALAYGGGVVVIAIALLSPLDRASDVLFSAHMAQHELLMLVAAPLVVLGRPLAPALWALPRPVRIGARRAVGRPWLRIAWRVLTAPLVALVLHAVTRWVWHVPGAFEAALADERVHAFQHVTFFATAVLFWWTLVHGRYGRAGYGVGVAFVFFTMLHSGLLAALLGLAGAPLYDGHALATAAWGLDATEDQQRAGLIMWVPAGIVMTAIGIAIAAAWIGHSARAVAGSAHPSLATRRESA